jgi:ATP-dependent DNA helicase RecG
VYWGRARRRDVDRGVGGRVLFNLESVDDIALMQESVNLACKLAAGRDGRGIISDNFWKTYFANGHGGIVLLWVKEKLSEKT